MVRRFFKQIRKILGWVLFIPVLPILLWAKLAAERGHRRVALRVMQPLTLALCCLASKEHPASILLHYFIGTVYFSMGDYVRAKPLLIPQALEIQCRLLGEEHPHHAASLRDLAWMSYKVGLHDRAEALLLRALEIQRRVVGEKHPHYAETLVGLAFIYEYIGSYDRAQDLLVKALEICRVALGEEHLDYLTSLNNLATLYQRMGSYDRAKPLMLQEAYATALNNLANLYVDTGRFGGAEPLLVKALEICRRVHGDRHPAYAVSLNNLASLYVSTDQYDRAEPLLVEALEIKRCVLGDEHADYATTLSNLGTLYVEMGRYDRAESLMLQALDVQRRVLGEEHPDHAGKLNNLALLYMDMCRYDRAESLMFQALDVQRRVLGEEHASYANSLHNLGWLYYRAGVYAYAEPPLYLALSTYNRLRLTEHPHYGATLMHFAVLRALQGRYIDASECLQKESKIRDQLIAQVFSFSDEHRRLEYLQKTRVELDLFLSLIWNHFPDSPEHAATACNLILRRKGLTAEALAAQRDALWSGRHPELRPLFEELAALREQIARLTLHGAEKGDPRKYREYVEGLQRRREELEHQLARAIPEMQLEERLRKADRQAVALALPEGAALVEFVRFDVFDFQAVSARGQKRQQPARYLAFVMTKNQPDEVKMVDLGEAEPIDALITTFRNAIVEDENARGAGNTQQAPSRFAEAGRQLRAAVFAPLVEALGESKKLYLSPDSSLCLFPFEVLPGENGKYLVDEYKEISYVSTGRDLIRLTEAKVRNATPSPDLVAADPDFLLGLKEQQESAEQCSTEKEGDQERPKESHTRKAARDAGVGFEPLPGTRKEGEQVAKKLGVQPLLQEKVLEMQLKKCRSPRILHIATHGFFLPDPERDPKESLFNIGLDGGRMRGPGMENPMLRSGLALAGAQTWLNGDEPPEEAEDGLLTAEDVTGMDLIDTEMVVLSACETGIGEALAGEGVFGLRRAFDLAGARTLIMSMWKVPDEVGRRINGSVLFPSVER